MLENIRTYILIAIRTKEMNFKEADTFSNTIFTMKILTEFLSQR